MAKYALFAGVEQLALWVCDHGAEELALHCAEGDAALYASYLKTLDFVVDFAVKHGVCGALNKKLATANGYSSRQFNLNKPHEFRSGKTSSGAKYSERVVRAFGEGRFWDGLISGSSGHSDLKDMAIKYTKRTKSKVRFDKYGFAYRFDPAHQYQKVHLHKYEVKKSNKVKLIAEVDPETGEIIKHIYDGKTEKW